MVWCWWLIHMWILWFNIVWRGELCIDSLLCLLLTLFYLIWLFICMMLSRWSAVQSCSWDERIVSVQFKEEMNIWSLESYICNNNTQQSTSHTTFRRRRHIVQTNSNRMQQYSIILAQNLSLDVYTKVYTTNWVEKQWQFTTLRLAETIHNRRRDPIDSYHTAVFG
jgi:hypothetical protein